MKIKNPVEAFLISLMQNWVNNAPEDGRKGVYEGDKKVNSQMARAAYILKIIGVAEEDKIFNKLAIHCRRNDGNSYISKTSNWMEKPLDLGGGWFFEGGTSLSQKQNILRHLNKIGYSSVFVSCVEEFVAGRSVVDFFPTEKEADEILRKIQNSET
ncbi:hypothetical protein [Halomonas daqiaonensis]|uniref:hypothetical protein n=1 Tax=Halomonas daqiaonensis TaxID=650850 RepID=UPI001114218C|nr:hypothetical protein [Halomonas daqiaonensis]